MNEAQVLEATVERPTVIDLDPEHDKMVGEFDVLVKGAPSLRECTRLKVRGPVIFRADDRLSGAVSLYNPAKVPRPLSELQIPVCRVTAIVVTRHTDTVALRRPLARAGCPPDGAVTV